MGRELKLARGRARRSCTPRRRGENAVEAVPGAVSGQRPLEGIRQLEARTIDTGQQRSTQSDRVGERFDLDTENPGMLDIGPVTGRDGPSRRAKSSSRTDEQLAEAETRVIDSIAGFGVRQLEHERSNMLRCRELPDQSPLRGHDRS